MVRDRPAIGVGRYHRALCRVFQHIAERAVRRVGKIYDHSQFIHPADHLYPEGLQPLPHHGSVLAGGMSDAVFVIPHNRHQPYAASIEIFQPLHLPIQDSAFFHRQECGYPSFCGVFLQLCIRAGKGYLPFIRCQLRIHIGDHLKYMFICLIVPSVGLIIFYISKACKKLSLGSRLFHGRDADAAGILHQVPLLIQIHQFP